MMVKPVREACVQAHAHALQVAEIDARECHHDTRLNL